MTDDRPDDVVEYVLEFETPVTPGDLEQKFTELAERVRGDVDFDAEDDGFDVREIPIEGRPRKTSYQPRSDGTWMAVDLVWDGGRWRPVGQEILEEIAVETADGVIGP